MSTILTGTSRTALSFIRHRWADLIQVSLAPFAAMLALMTAQAMMYRSVILDFVPMIESGNFDANTMSTMMNMQGIGFIATIAGALIGAWYFVRVVRLYFLGEKPWLGLGKIELMASLMTALYLLGIYFLTIVAYIGALLVGIIPLVVVGIATHDSGEPSPALIALFVAWILATVVFVLWFSCRFAVGLPSVALGETPDFFKGIWPLARGNSWGFPLRLIAVSIVAALVLIPASLIYIMVFAHDVWSAIINPGDRTVLSEHFFETVFDRLIAGQAVWLILEQPLLWFCILLNAEIFRRLSAAPSG